jgi:FKBP-type peptidyl-prolyl cis-trans isomerase SlpA
VLVHFTLKLEDGSTAESTRAAANLRCSAWATAACLTAGKSELIGLRAGDKCFHAVSRKPLSVPRSPDLVQYFSRRDFAETGVPDVGTIMLFTAVTAVKCRA